VASASHERRAQGYAIERFQGLKCSFTQLFSLPLAFFPDPFGIALIYSSKRDARQGSLLSSRARYRRIASRDSLSGDLGFNRVILCVARSKGENETISRGANPAVSLHWA
jgi:hypothetical protein